MQATKKMYDDATLQQDWRSSFENLAYVHGRPCVRGRIKFLPSHFRVCEVMEISPSGEGEHDWLDISKTRLNTDTVAKSLARYSGVAYRDVGYSGLKDFNAETRQWFSVWKPKGPPVDWSAFNVEGVRLNQVVRHNRKIKRGTHRANTFQIRLHDLNLSDQTRSDLVKRLEGIQQTGAPNYFGSQRFGRNMNNMSRLMDLFLGNTLIKDRNLRSILLSAGRSWLFNQVVSERIKAGSWQSLYLGESVTLDGTNSVFKVDDLTLEMPRFINLDIHPTAPMWGRIQGSGQHNITPEFGSELFLLEQAALADYDLIKEGLENARLDYQRRPIRLLPKRLQWRFENNDLCLSFELHKGQFASSLIRELIHEFSD